MKTTIKHLHGKDAKTVSKIIKDNYVVYGKPTKEDLLHPDYFGVYDENDTLIGFYGIAWWGNAITMCFVYVMPKYRHKGIFTKMVNRVIGEYTKVEFIGIWAEKNNSIANQIYSQKFFYVGMDDEKENIYYLIKNRNLCLTNV